MKTLKLLAFITLNVLFFSCGNNTEQEINSSVKSLDNPATTSYSYVVYSTEDNYYPLRHIYGYRLYWDKIFPSECSIDFQIHSISRGWIDDPQLPISVSSYNGFINTSVKDVDKIKFIVRDQAMRTVANMTVSMIEEYDPVTPYVIHGERVIYQNVVWRNRSSSINILNTPPSFEEFQNGVVMDPKGMWERPKYTQVI